MHIMIVCTYSSTRVVLVEGMMQIKEQETFVESIIFKSRF